MARTNTGAPAVELKELSKSYGSHEALRHIDAAIEHGEIFCLVGRNGAGKTTLMKMI
jgi:simple sugar transport system ATP-binding protein